MCDICLCVLFGEYQMISNENNHTMAYFAPEYNRSGWREWAPNENEDNKKTNKTRQKEYKQRIFGT